MARREDMKELFDKADKIQPIAEKDGEKFVTFEDASVLNSLNAFDPKGTGMLKRNMDGSIASTGKTVHAVNPNYFFMNRFKVEDGKLYVVSGHEPTGWRCIQEQSKGKIFIKTIPCYVIVRDEKKKLKLEKVTTVSDTEFVSDFVNTLDHKSMAEVLPLIASSGEKMTAETMPI